MKYSPRGVGVAALPTTATKVRDRRPLRYTVTVRSLTLTTTCQVVAERRVLEAVIQPVFGGVLRLKTRPGRRTFSQVRPSASVCSASTGSVVRVSVIGRWSATATSVLLPNTGLAVTHLTDSSVTVSCRGSGVALLRAACAPTGTSSSDADTAAARSIVRPAWRTDGGQLRCAPMLLIINQFPDLSRSSK